MTFLKLPEINITQTSKLFFQYMGILLTFPLAVFSVRNFNLHNFKSVGNTPYDRFSSLSSE